MKDLEAGGGTLEARNQKSQRQSGNKAVPFRKVEGEIERAVKGQVLEAALASLENAIRGAQVLNHSLEGRGLNTIRTSRLLFSNPCDFRQMLIVYSRPVPPPFFFFCIKSGCAVFV